MSKPVVRVARPHRPAVRSAAQSFWIVEAASGAGGPGGTAGQAPPVTIVPPPTVIFRNDHKVEVDIDWVPNAAATDANFSGVAVYLEDPDISSGANPNMNGIPLNDTSQMSAQWAPVFVNNMDVSPAVVFPDTTMGSTAMMSYVRERTIRVYLAAYGPNSPAKLVRATEPNATPNIMVDISPPGPGNSGMEYAFLVTNVRCVATPDYDRPDPQFYMQFFYTPPDPNAPVPPGLNKFGGVRIYYVYLDATGNPVFPGTDTGMNIPVAQSQAGFKSPTYPAVGLMKFRCYFCSEDDAQPLGLHINSLVDGVTPYCSVSISPPGGAPDVTSFTISGQTWIWQLDGSFVAQATFAWNLPTVAGSVRYAGVYLYLVGVTGSGDPSKWTKYPTPLTSQQSNSDTGFVLQIPNIPNPGETWTIAAISVDNNGKLSDDPKNIQHSPRVTWNIGPPSGSGSPGIDYAPLVTLNNATASDKQTVSTDGVGMVSFTVGPWTEPASGQYGGTQIAMVVGNSAPSSATYWTVPKGQTTFTTPPIPTFGNAGAGKLPLTFYLVSDDPQGHKNQIIPGVTPTIPYANYQPNSGAIIPARSGWFDTSQFQWTATIFQAFNFAAQIINVGQTLVVGGAPTLAGGDSRFKGGYNGQIAVKDANGKLLDWFGMQQPTQGQGNPLWGAWLGQVWIGGTSPLDAPVFVDNQGIIEVGGIAAQKGTSYPFISVRNNSGYEVGRIGAHITQPTGGVNDGIGSNPPLALTDGAWFQQFAAGGANLTNWNILLVPNGPQYSQFQMRNVNLFQIDYPANSGTMPYNAHYQMQFGTGVWHGAGTSQYQFPGIKIYETDAGGNPTNFGTTLISRGLVIQGPQAGNPTLVALDMFNNAQSGADTPNVFWGELSMFSPNSPFNRTVYLASGGATTGNASFQLSDVNSATLFSVHNDGSTIVGGILMGIPVAQTGAATPVISYAYSVGNPASPIPVIDSTGKWVGQPISGSGGGGSQSPWTGPIAGGGFPLTNAGNIQCASLSIVGKTGYNPNNQNPSGYIIGADSAFYGAGVDVGSGGIGGSYILDRGNMDVLGVFHSSSNAIVSSNTAANPINPSSFPASGGYIAGDHLYAGVDVNSVSGYGVNGTTVINGQRQFVGAGINIGSGTIASGPITAAGDITSSTAFRGGNVYAARFYINGKNGYIGTSSTNTTLAIIDNDGGFYGAGVDVGPSGGILCGNLVVSSAAGYGKISSGSQNCAGLICDGTPGALGGYVMYGHMTCTDYYVGPTGAAPPYPSPGTTLVIDSAGNFRGPSVSTGALSCTSLNLSGALSATTLTLSSGASNAITITTTGSALVVAGVAVVDGARNVFGVNLYCVNWSNTKPVVSSTGVFQGASINIGGGGITCGAVISSGNGQFAAHYTGGSLAINSSNQFVGAGILCPNNGLGALGFNPWANWASGVNGAASNQLALSSGSPTTAGQLPGQVYYGGMTGYMVVTVPGGTRTLVFMGGSLVRVYNV